MRAIDLIILHCTASDNPSQDNIDSITELHTSTKPIKWGNYSTHGKGWGAIGYHYVITKDGEIHIGRGVNIAGAHCRGFNKHSIGIALCGDTEFTQAQFDALRELCDDLLLQFGLDLIDIVLHNELNKNKTCPNFTRKEIWT